MGAVIFDLDGTLADTSGDMIAAANHCFGSMGYGGILDPVLDAATGMRGGRAMLRLGFSRLGMSQDDAILDEWYPKLLAAYAANICTHTKLFDGVIEAILALKSAGYKTGICTNKPVALAAQLLKALEISHHFDVLIGAGSLAVTKPDPAPLRAAIDGLGGTQARACLVGDTITDHKTARALGVPSILVSFGAGHADVHGLGPDAIIDHFDHLPAVVARLLP